MTPEEKKADILATIEEAGNTPQVTVDDVLATSQRGQQERQVFNAYEDAQGPMNDVANVAHDVIVDPFKKMAGAGLALTAQATGNETLQGYSDIVQGALYRDDLMSRGPDVNAPGQVDKANLMTEMTAFLGPTAVQGGVSLGVKALVKGQTNRAITKQARPIAEAQTTDTLRGLKFGEQPRTPTGQYKAKPAKGATAPNTLFDPKKIQTANQETTEAALRSAKMLTEQSKGAPKPSSYIGEVFKTEAKINTTGTAGITPLYNADEEGNVTTVDNPFKDIATGITANAMFSLPISLPFGVAKASKAKKSRAVFKETKMQTMAADETVVNIGDQTIAEFGKGTNSPETVFPADAATPEAMKRMNENGQKNVIKLDDGSIILNSEKLGTMRLYKNEAGQYYTKKQDGNIFTDDAYAMGGAGGRLLQPIMKEEVYADSTNSDGYGYNSIRTSTFSTTNIGKKVTKWSTDIPPAINKDVGKYSKDTFPTGERTSPPKNSVVQRKPSILSETLVASSKAEDAFVIPQEYSNINSEPTFITAMNAAKTIRDSVQEMFGHGKENKVIYSGTLEAVHNIVDTFLNSNKGKYKDIAETVGTINKQTKQLTVKDQFAESFNLAYDSALTKVVASIKKGTKKNGSDYYFYDPAEIGDFASSIVNDALKHSGIFKKGTEFELFKNELTNAVKNELSSEKLLGGRTKPTTSGNVVEIGTVEGQGSTRAFTSGNTILEGIMDSDIKGVNEIIKDIDTKIATAKALAESDVLKLSSITNTRKMTIKYKPEKVKATPESLEDGSFFNNLDNDSVPLYAYKDGDAFRLSSATELYEVMTNTSWYYRGGDARAMTIVDNIIANQGNTKLLARYLGLITPEQALRKGSLEQVIGNVDSFNRITKDITALLEEAIEHKAILEIKPGKKGLQFGVMQVGTSRMQYSGYINPQQGVLSKKLFTTDTARSSFKNKTSKEKFFGAGVRTAADELKKADPDLFRELFTDKEIKAIEVASDAELIQFAKNAVAKMDNIPRSIDEHISMDTLREVGKGTDDGDVSMIVAEYDAVTSMIGIVDMYLKRVNENTGVGAKLNKTNDAYEVFGKAIDKAFSFIETLRPALKQSTQGGGYGQKPRNIAEGQIYLKLSEALADTTTTTSKKALDGVAASIKSEVLLKESELFTSVNKMLEKMKAIEKTKELEDLIDRLIDTQKLMEGNTIKDRNVVNATKLISYADQLETLKMKMESSTMKRNADIDASLLQTDTIRLMTLMTKVKSKDYNNITYREIEAASAMLANSKRRVVTNALRKAFGDDFITLQSRTKETFQKGYFQTRILLQNMHITSEFAGNVYKELGIKGPDKLNLESHIANSSVKNTWDFIDALHIMGYDALTSNSIYSLLPKFKNGFGDPVAFVTNKGTGFHADTSMQYSMLSVINDPLPYLLHSTDSSLVSKATRGQNFANHRWDAFFDSNGFEVAHEANMASDWLRRNANIYKNMEESHISADRVVNANNKVGGIDTLEIARDMARQEFALAGKKMTNEALNSRAKEIIKELNNRDLIKDVAKDKDKLNTLSKKLESENTTMQHYTNEDPATSIDITPTDSAKMKNMETVLESTQAHPSAFDPRLLKNVDTTDFTINELAKLETLSTYDTVLTADISAALDGTSSMYDGLGNKVIIDVASSDKTFFTKLAHEVLHAVGTKVFKEENTAKMFVGIKEALNKYDKDNGGKGFAVGERDFGKSDVMIYEEGLLESRTGTTGMDPTVLYGNELSASMLDKLLANEIIYANKQTVAKLGKTTDLTDRLQTLSILDRNTGKVTDLYTVSDLVSFLESHGIDGYSSTIGAYTSKAMGIINGSTHIKDLMYSKPKSKFETTIRGVEQGWGPSAKLVKVANETLSKIDFLDLYKLDPKLEAVLKAVNQTKGAVGDIHRFLESSYEQLSKDMENEFGTDSIQYERAMGQHWNLGVNKLFYAKINGKLDFLNLKKSKIVDPHSGQILEKSAMKREFETRIDDFFKFVEGKGKNLPAIKAESKALKKKIKGLAQGSKGYQVTKVAKELNDLLVRTHGAKAVEHIDTKLAIQKVAAMYSINKNHAEFKKVTERLAGHEAILDSYMEMTNRHENPYSLFGDNVEMQFMEDGKTGRAITMKEFKSWNGRPEDVVATGLKDADGNQYAVIKTDASERIIRRQPSEILTMELSNFEKGIYEADGIRINGQTNLGQINGLDNGIVKQMTRNMYINFNKSVTKDVAYRQWQLLRDQGILMTKAEADTILKNDDRAQMIPLSKDNPYTKITGSQYYIDQRFKHYLEGDKGIDARGIGKSVAGNTQYAKFVENSVIGLNKTVNVLANFILVTHPASYINSFLSSMTVYAAHIKGIPDTRDVSMAKKGLQGYRDVMNTFADIYMKDQKKGLEYWNTDVKTHAIHALVDAGVVNTIRADMYKVASPRQFALYGAIHKATGDTNYANALKSLAFDPSTKHGNLAAEFFDYTELLPKVMLFENLKRNGMSVELAGQKVMMAFPTYNNLPAMFNAMGVAVPYLKFFAALPKMIMYGVDQSPMRTIGGVVAAQSVVPLSYAMASEAEQKAWKWNIDNGFIKVPFVDWSYASMSLFPLWSNPLSSPFGTSPWQADFAISAAGSIGDLRKYVLPGTPLPEVTP